MIIVTSSSEQSILVLALTAGSRLFDVDKISLFVIMQQLPQDTLLVY